MSDYIVTRSFVLPELGIGAAVPAGDAIRRLKAFNAELQRSFPREEIVPDFAGAEPAAAPVDRTES